jgi:2-acylglycerol O-acyltransferase 2
MSATPPHQVDTQPAPLPTKVETVTPPPSEQNVHSSHDETEQQAADNDTTPPVTLDAETTNAKTEEHHHVRWAPLKVPLNRRLQMLAVLFYISLLMLCLSTFIYSFLIPFLWPLLVAYVTFIYLDKAPENGGRRMEWTRKLPVWKYFCDYYPISLVKVKKKKSPV